MHSDSSLQSESQRRHTLRSVTLTSVGENRENSPNSTVNASPCLSHVCLPNAAMPAHMTTEYRITITESVLGMNAPVNTFSAHANTKNSTSAGQTSRPSGYRNGGLSRPSRDPVSLWYNSKVIFQGLTATHTLPTSATTYPIPTHQMIQMNVGEMLSMGRSVPTNPATTISKKIATESALTAADAIPARQYRSRHRRPKQIQARIVELSGGSLHEHPKYNERQGDRRDRPD